MWHAGKQKIIRVTLWSQRRWVRTEQKSMCRTETNYCKCPFKTTEFELGKNTDFEGLWYDQATWTMGIRLVWCGENIHTSWEGQEIFFFSFRTEVCCGRQGTRELKMAPDAKSPSLFSSHAQAPQKSSVRMCHSEWVILLLLEPKEKN